MKSKREQPKHRCEVLLTLLISVVLTPSAAGVQEPAQKIAAVYRVHNTAKLKSLPALLDKYAGHQEQLLTTVMEKYSVTVADLEQLLQLEAERPTDAGGGRHCLAPGDRPNPHAASDTAPEEIPWAVAKTMSGAAFFAKTQQLEPLLMSGAAGGPTDSWTMENVELRMGRRAIHVEVGVRSAKLLQRSFHSLTVWCCFCCCEKQVSKPGASFKSGEAGTTRQRMTFARFRELSNDPSVQVGRDAAPAQLRQQLLLFSLCTQAYWANDQIPDVLAHDLRIPRFLEILNPAVKSLIWWGAGGQITKAHYDTYGVDRCSCRHLPLACAGVFSFCCCCCC